jgi:hypothetical protein
MYGRQVVISQSTFEVHEVTFRNMPNFGAVWLFLLDLTTVSNKSQSWNRGTRQARNISNLHTRYFFCIKPLPIWLTLRL